MNAPYDGDRGQGAGSSGYPEDYPDRDAGRHFQKLDSVSTREVRNRAERALAPQELVRKARNVAHVDAGADDGSAALDGL